jgi:hypothetical protein
VAEETRLPSNLLWTTPLNSVLKFFSSIMRFIFADDLPTGCPFFMTRVLEFVIRPSALDHPKAESSGFAQGDGLVTPPRFRQHDQTLVAGRTALPFLVVVSASRLQLFGIPISSRFRSSPSLESVAEISS